MKKVFSGDKFFFFIMGLGWAGLGLWHLNDYINEKFITNSNEFYLMCAAFLLSLLSFSLIFFLLGIRIMGRRKRRRENSPKK